MFMLVLLLIIFMYVDGPVSAVRCEGVALTLMWSLQHISQGEKTIAEKGRRTEIVSCLPLFELVLCGSSL